MWFIKHLMTGPSGSSEFCFPETSMKVDGNQNSLFSRGPSYEAFYYTCYTRAGFQGNRNAKMVRLEFFREESYIRSANNSYIGQHIPRVCVTWTRRENKLAIELFLTCIKKQVFITWTKYRIGQLRKFSLTFQPRTSVVAIFPDTNMTDLAPVRWFRPFS